MIGYWIFTLRIGSDNTPLTKKMMKEINDRLAESEKISLVEIMENYTINPLKTIFPEESIQVDEKGKIVNE